VFFDDAAPLLDADRREPADPAISVQM